MFQVEDVCIQAHTRLTDGNGTAYMHAVSNYMEHHLLYDTAKEIFNQYEVVKYIKENSGWDIWKIDDALEQLHFAKENTSIENSEEKEHKESSAVGSSKIVEQQKNNPLEVIKQLQKHGILELVLKDTESISKQKIALENAVSNRTLESGNQTLEETQWMDNLFLQQYLLHHSSNFCDKKEEHALFYEAEYLIGGKEYDYQNLKIVAEELMLIREATNLLYLMSDMEKVEEAQVLATALVGISGNPVLIEAVKAGILTAWAFGESILDVRALLQKKQIPLLKNKNLWTLDLTHISALSDGYMTAKESEQGLSYEDYLGILCLFQSEHRLAMRGMDVQELTLQTQYQNPQFFLDQLVINVNVKVNYEYEPIFYTFLYGFERWNPTLSIVQSYGYE